MMNEIKSKIRAFIVENFLYGEDSDLEDDTSFLGEGIIDSTGILELVGFLEETYDLEVDDDELLPENLDSLDNVTAYLASKM